MDTMRSSLYTIAITAVSAGILDIFAQSGTLKKYVKYSISLLVIIALLLPISNLITDIPDSIFQPPEEDIINNNTSSAVEETITLAIQNNITSRFSIPQDAIHIKVNTTSAGDEILINKIIVTIKDNAYFPQQERILYFLKSIAECDVEVVQDIKE